MAKQFFIILMFFFSMTIHCFAIEYYIYTNEVDTKVYELSKMSSKGKSISDICELLGYNRNMCYVWFSRDFNTVYCIKTFSTDVFCILSRVDLGQSVSQYEVRKTMVSNGFDYNKEYPAYKKEKDLSEGILYNTISQSFLEDVLHTKAENQTIRDEINGYTYYFKDGYLNKFTSNDGLCAEAKEYKGTALFDLIKKNAEKYNYTSDAVISEINQQFIYMNKIERSYLTLAKSDKYDFNFVLLYVDLHCPKMSMSDFIKITHDKAEVVSISTNVSILKYNYNYYNFDSNKILFKIN